MGFQLYLMFVVDFLHEIELGVWKAVFSHCIRLLYAHDPNAVHELNKQYGSFTMTLPITHHQFNSPYPS